MDLVGGVMLLAEVSLSEGRVVPTQLADHRMACAFLI